CPGWMEGPELTGPYLCAQRPPGMRPAQVPWAETETTMPVLKSPMRGTPVRSVPNTRELSIHPHVWKSVNVVWDPSTTVSRKLDAFPLSSADWLLLGERYAGSWPWIENERVVVPDQSSTFACASVSQIAPPAEGGPAMMQVGPPSVALRVVAGGSMRCSSCGPQQNGPPPWAHT